MKKQAFTLAETLIALTIIGVIAAITVPALIQRTNKQEYAAAMIKAYSTLSQAANQIIAENGTPKCNEGGWGCSAESIFNMFKKYLNNAKECKSGKGCSPRTIKYFVSGSETWRGWNTLFLADGTQVLFGAGFNADCSYREDQKVNGCINIIVDVNGLKKPNQGARDIFTFWLTDTGLKVQCVDDELCRNEGIGCACKILRDGAMNY